MNNNSIPHACKEKNYLDNVLILSQRKKYVATVHSPCPISHYRWKMEKVLEPPLHIMKVSYSEKRCPYHLVLFAETSPGT
jgi:hypothetical protein